MPACWLTSALPYLLLLLQVALFNKLLLTRKALLFLLSGDFILQLPLLSCTEGLHETRTRNAKVPFRRDCRRGKSNSRLRSTAVSTTSASRCFSTIMHASGRANTCLRSGARHVAKRFCLCTSASCKSLVYCTFTTHCAQAGTPYVVTHGVYVYVASAVTESVVCAMRRLVNTVFWYYGPTCHETLRVPSP